MSKHVSHKYISHSPSETKKIAADIIKEVWPTTALGGPPGKAVDRREGSLVLALAGDLGAGKTTFVQGVARFLGIEQTIASPTFILMKRYEIQEEQATSLGLGGLCNLYHFDCYRLDFSQDILDLGWKEIISTDGNLILVEWAEKIKDILPPDTVWVRMESRSENEREIVVEI